ncbi:unnamed protein product, partial [Cuscuta campestris]
MKSAVQDWMQGFERE